MSIDVSKLRISKLRDYLFDVVDSIVADTKYQINANMLDNDINNYSLDKIPTQSTVEMWITGLEIHRDTFNLRARFAYSQDIINNLENIGFGEIFEQLINDNNKKGIMPEIDEIESIKCLSPLTLIGADTNTAQYSTQIEIKYRIGG